MKALKLWYAVELKIEETEIDVQLHSFMAELMAKRRPLLLQPGNAGRPSLKAQDLINVLECAIAIKEGESGLSNKSLYKRVSEELLKKGISLTSEGVRYELSRAFEKARLEVKGTYHLEDLRHALERLKAGL